MVQTGSENNWDNGISCPHVSNAEAGCYEVQILVGEHYPAEVKFADFSTKVEYMTIGSTFDECTNSEVMVENQCHNFSFQGGKMSEFARVEHPDGKFCQWVYEDMCMVIDTVTGDLMRFGPEAKAVNPISAAMEWVKSVDRLTGSRHVIVPIKAIVQHEIQPAHDFQFSE